MNWIALPPPPPSPPSMRYIFYNGYEWASNWWRSVSLFGYKKNAHGVLGLTLIRTHIDLDTFPCTYLRLRIQIHTTLISADANDHAPRNDRLYFLCSFVAVYFSALHFSSSLWFLLVSLFYCCIVLTSAQFAIQFAFYSKCARHQPSTQFIIERNGISYF